ncbi:MAG: threonine aldolase family protein [Pseudomonadota bacterium]
MAYAPLPPDANMPPVRINLYSDTQTKPTPAMKDVMMAAEVGDEQHGSDPTVRALCEKVAALLGKEAAIFLPSGTMCNVIAILVHCQKGQEVVAHETSHILTSEGGAHAALAGVQIHPLKGPAGTFDSETLREAVRAKSRHAPEQRLLSLEQTANIGGGTVWPTSQLSDVIAIAREENLAVHVDGARLMNAVVASNNSARAYGDLVDSVWIDFTKGLGAPLGAALAGDADFIDQAWRWKQRLGGAMRQAGICAAGCIYSLDHHVERLAEDHANARYLAEQIGKIDGVTVDQPHTNLVYFDPAGAGLKATELVQRVRGEGLLLSVLGGRIRACTHLDVNKSMIDEAIEIMSAALAAAK